MRLHQSKSERFVLRALGLLAMAAIMTVRAMSAAAAGSAGAELRVYFIDVEGGQATLFITPLGESLLIDSGWPGNNYRDAERIASVARRAGLSRIDYVMITHYHDDHVGGVAQLVDRIAVGTFIDHGPNRELDHGKTESGYAAYQAVLASGKSKRILAQAGEVLPVQGIEATVVSADGNLIGKALPDAGQPNPYCQASETRPADQTENARSLGIDIAFGELKILDLGDLTWDKEMQLMCPVNRIGLIDVYVVSHHGLYQSSSPALVDAIQPRVAIMDNGANKGGSIQTFETLAKVPRLETLWQLHFSNGGGMRHNTAVQHIANIEGPDAGHYLELTGHRDGSFDVFNSRTATSGHYSALH